MVNVLWVKCKPCFFEIIERQGWLTCCLTMQVRRRFMTSSNAIDCCLIANRPKGFQMPSPTCIFKIQRNGKNVFFYSFVMFATANQYFNKKRWRTKRLGLKCDFWWRFFKTFCLYHPLEHSILKLLILSTDQNDEFCFLCSAVLFVKDQKLSSLWCWVQLLTACFKRMINVTRFKKINSSMRSR